jgi:hypothetical protein
MKNVLVIALLMVSTVSLADPSFTPERNRSIKSVNGRLYAYIVLLFNENPHFVNLIQKGTIPLNVIGDEGFHVREYKRYLRTINNSKIRELAQLMLSVYLEPKRYSSHNLGKIEKNLEAYNIILRFSRNFNTGLNQITLEYCIFARRIRLEITHPLIKTREVIYNIQPFIYYDEFSTSNSTFYYDMVYINPDEVTNDAIIAHRVLKDQNVQSMFFVGSVVNDDIKYCLSRAFNDSSRIREEIWRMFVLHELTHKIINNRYNHFDQITGEELSLSCTIYANPYLGMSVLYSYMNYNAINPHRIAAINYIQFVSEETGRAELVENPGLLKFIPEDELKRLSKRHFYRILQKLKLVQK